jgi:endonuclease-8
VLAAAFDENRVVRNLRRHPDLEIGVALLDQEILAGLGNYLKSEVLFATETNRRARVRDLTSAQLKSVVRASWQVSQRAYENSGYTISDSVRDLAEQPGVSPKTVGRRHWVFRRTNKPCLACGDTIRQFRQGDGKGRLTYVCPTCQQVPI